MVVADDQSFWIVEQLRSLPAESIQWRTEVQFVGGMFDGRTKQLPVLSNLDGPLALNGYDYGRPICHVKSVVG